ncbi:MAG: class I SAM-dependent RNA methyltransferase [Lachnospiraceae bacterium]|nr:class I SAM-dependent RNA methyltransferase [Lachnospiraceae bacterium]
MNNQTEFNNVIYDCSLGGICGGCYYCNCSYEDQLQEKNERVRTLLEQAAAPYADSPYIYEGIIPSPLLFGYRNKMEYSFGDCAKDGPLTLGLHRKKSFYDVIDVDCCRLVHNDCNLVVKAAADYFRGLGLTYTDKRSHLGYLRYLIIRRAVNTGEMLVDLVTTSQPLIPVEKHSEISSLSLYDREAFAAGKKLPAEGVNALDQDEVLKTFAEKLLEVQADPAFEGRIRGILHTVNDTLADAVRNDGTTILYGQDHITEELLSLEFRISPFSFFQTNSRGAEVLYSKVREYIVDELEQDMHIYDLYSGTGTIAQMLAPCVREVTGVEIVPEAVEAAKKNAAMNGLGNCRFIADDVLKALDSLPAPDALILDPPRDGVNPKALRKIIDYGVKNMIYVSCKPESLARDLVMLQAAGYRIIKAAAVDQFPWTKNVETVVLLSRAGAFRQA